MMDNAVLQFCIPIRPLDFSDGISSDNGAHLESHFLDNRRPQESNTVRPILVGGVPRAPQVSRHMNGRKIPKAKL
jgi:hypothetical protein